MAQARARLLTAVVVVGAVGLAVEMGNPNTASAAQAAKECWALTNLQGQSAASGDDYRLGSDKFANPMVLCFAEETGTVTGDDSIFIRFGPSTLAGGAQANGLELFEVYQIDRERKKVLFIKSRVGPDRVLPGAAGFIGAFVGDATPLTAK